MQKTPAKSSASWAPAAISAIAVLAMCVFIFVMSARPADESDALSLGVVYQIVGFIVPGYDQMSPADQLYWQHLLNHPVRKTAHFLEFAALGALVLNLLVQVKRLQIGREKPAPVAALKSHIRRLIIEAWVLATLYAATDELHQAFVPGRTPKPTDVLIDSAGILFGVLFVALVLHLIAKRKPRAPQAQPGANSN